jgi:hypothetical protein
VRVRPEGRFLKPRRVPKNFLGPLRGRAVMGKSFYAVDVPEAPASREQGRAQACPEPGPVQPRLMPARAQRKRLWEAVLTGSIVDTVACLRGPVNRGAEKRKGS